MNLNFTNMSKTEIIKRYYKKDYNDILKTISMIYGIIIGKNFNYSKFIFSTENEDLAYFVIKLFEKIGIECLVFKRLRRFEVEINKEDFEINILKEKIYSKYEIHLNYLILGLYLSSRKNA